MRKEAKLDPNLAVTAGLTILDGVLGLIAHLKEQANMTDEQIIAHADSLDLKNKDDIKALLAL